MSSDHTDSLGQQPIGKAEGVNVDNLIRQALHCYQHNELQDCEQICLQILDQAPADFSGNQILGVVRARQGRFGEAVKHLVKAYEIRPQSAAVLYNMANIMEQLDRLPEAIIWLNRVINLDEKDVNGFYRRGDCELRLGRDDEALASFRKALEIKADHQESLVKAITIWQKKGQMTQALEAVRLANFSFDNLTPRQDHDEPNITDRFILANCELRLRFLDEQIARKPMIQRLTETDITLAITELGQYSEALYQRFPQGHWAILIRASYCLAQEQAEDAKKLWQMLPSLPLSTHPNSDRVNSWLAVGNSEPLRLAHYYQTEGDLARLRQDWQQAENAYAKALLHNPKANAAEFYRGDVLRASGRLSAAVGCYQRVLQRDAIADEAAAAMGLCQLILENFEEGLRHYEKRNPVASLHLELGQDKGDLHEMVWNGQDRLNGKSIVIFSEQRVLDYLLFGRYIPFLGDRPSSVTLLLRRGEESLSGLVQQHRSVTQIVTLDEPLPKGDVWIALASLPLLFATNQLNAVPLTPLFRLTQKFDEDHEWRQDGDKEAEIIIGLVPARASNQAKGAPNLADLLGTLPEFIWSPHDELPIKILVLQSELSEADHKLLKNYPHLHHPQAILDNYYELANLCRTLKLVIGVEDPVLHLAANFCRPTRLLLERPELSQSWWWGKGGDTTPWYPEARVYRTAQNWNWTEVLTELKEDLDYEGPSAWQMTSLSDDEPQEAPPTIH